MARHTEQSGRSDGIVGFLKWEFARLLRMIPPALLLILGWSIESFAGEREVQGQIALGTDPSAVDRLLGMTVTLVIILGVIVIGGLLLRRFRVSSSGRSGGMQIRGHLALGPKERIVLIEAGKTQLLVGLTPGRLETLHVLDSPIEVEVVEDTGDPSFAARLRSVMGRG